MSKLLDRIDPTLRSALEAAGYAWIDRLRGWFHRETGERIEQAALDDARDACTKSHSRV